MRTRSDAIPDAGHFEVWLVGQPGREDFLWVAGLVRQADAEYLAAQANQAAKAVGKTARYVVKEAVTR